MYRLLAVAKYESAMSFRRRTRGLPAAMTDVMGCSLSVDGGPEYAVVRSGRTAL